MGRQSMYFQMIHERPVEVRSMNATMGRSEYSILQKLALLICTLQAISLVAAFTCAISKPETILFTGPRMAVAGFAFAIETWSLRSWRVLAFGLSMPLMTATLAALIAAFRIRPGTARTLVPIVLALYVVIVFPLAAAAWERILHSPVAIRSLKLYDVTGWRFSTATLLKVTTALAILLVLTRFVVVLINRSDFMAFSAYAITVSMLCGLLAFFFSKHTGPRPATDA
jgi:hypothetical protein